MIDNFCQSHSYVDEKRNIFFHRNQKICNICNRPITKKILNINNIISIGLQYAGCLSGEVGHIDVGGGGHGGHQRYVIIAQFNHFRNIIFQSLIELTGVANNLTNDKNNLTNKVNNLTSNVNDLAEDTNDLTVTVNDGFNELSQEINNLN